MSFFTTRDLASLLYETNATIHAWGHLDGSERPQGACAGTVALVQGSELTLLHAGDTVGVRLRSNERPRVLTTPQERGGAIYSYFGIGAGLNI